jgi:hypothetical protein
MARPTYWLDLFTGTTWQEFLDASARVSGFRDSRWKTVQAIKRGDFLLCYLTGLSRFIGLLEVVSEPFRDDSKIWKDESFPARLKVKTTIALTPETAVPVHELRDQLSVFADLKSPNAWTGHFRGSPARWKTSDGLAVVKALEEAKANPIVREVDPAKLGRRPKALTAKIGPVSVPGTPESGVTETEVESDSTPHTELQALLLRLGSDMRLDVWVARNDRSKEWNGSKLGQFPRVKAELPLQFERNIEEYFKRYDVFYDRRKGYHKLSGKPANRILGIPALAQAVVSIIRQEPHLARAKPASLVKHEEEYSKVFSKSTPLPAYLVCANTLLTAQNALRADLGKSMNEIKSNFKHQICYVAVAMTVKKQRFGPTDLISPNPTTISVETILKATRLMVEWVAGYRSNKNITLDGVAKAEGFTDYIRTQLQSQHQSGLVSASPIEST